MRREEFTISGPVRLDVSTGSGNIQLLAGPAESATVELRGGPEDEYTVEMTGADLVVRPPLKTSGKRRFARTNIKVYLPDGSTASVRTASGDVTASVALHDLDVSTASGDLRVTDDLAGDLTIKTASGDTRSENVAGDVAIKSASGDVSLEEVGGELRLNSASGDVRAVAVAGAIEATLVSGDLTIRAVGGSSVRTRSVSGNIGLGIPPGRTVDLDMQSLSGEVINRISRSATTGERIPLTLSIKTVSGDLRLESA